MRGEAWGGLDITVHFRAQNNVSFEFHSMMPNHKRSWNVFRDETTKRSASQNGPATIQNLFPVWITTEHIAVFETFSTLALNFTSFFTFFAQLDKRPTQCAWQHWHSNSESFNSSCTWEPSPSITTHSFRSRSLSRSYRRTHCSIPLLNGTFWPCHSQDGGLDFTGCCRHKTSFRVRLRNWNEC